MSTRYVETLAALTETRDAMAKRLKHSQRTKQVEYKNGVVPGHETGVDAEDDLGGDH